MARDDELLLSSPDPLALSNKNVPTPSPVKARSTKPGAPVMTPRKPLVEASGNARVQDFFVSTPPARRNNNPPTITPGNAASTSPWRIRLTVQAEQVEEKGCGLRRKSSPTKRLAERTTTITVPLRAGDDSPPAAAKRGRGRPMKSSDIPRKRTGTPKPKMGGRRKPMPDSQEDNTYNQSLSTTTPPKKARGRPRKSLEAESAAPQFVTDSLLLTPMAEKVDFSAADGKATRTRSRGRRQEITPMRLGVVSDVETSHDSVRIAGLPIGQEQTPGGAIENYLPARVDHPQVYQPRLQRSQSPLLHSLPEPSVVGQQDEDIWRPMSQSRDASPNAGHEEQEKHQDADPTNEHYEYDTILESEGFSMVSIESLASAGNQSNESAKHQSTLSDRNNTPAIASSPSEPPAPHAANLQPLLRHVEEPRQGTPKLTRVVRAGVALQGVLSPNDRGQRLGSPFGESRKATSQTLSSPVSKEASPKQRLENIFGGYGVGTRRELRAGLRLGEELAKKQQELAQENKSDSGADEDVFHAATILQYPRLPESSAQTGYNLTIPGSKQGPGQDVCYPKLARNHLPTPERSEVDADEDRMSWKTDTPAKSEDTTGPTASVFANNVESEPDGSTIDYTMMAREAEWQRERDAISRQIEMANKSQVIVIDSDEEDDEQAEDQEKAFDDDDEGDSDIWQAEAHSGHYNREVTPEASDVMLHPDFMKPRRSKLPSPWRRNSDIMYSDEPEPTEVDSSQQTDHTQAKDRLRSNEITERPLDDKEYSGQSDDSTGALIASQLSPVKKSNIKLNNVIQESVDKTNDVSQSGDSTSVLIARQLSPTKDVTFAVTAAKVSSPSDSIRSFSLEDSGEQQVEADNVPATPENKCKHESSEIFEGDTTINSIDNQSNDRSPCWSVKKPLGKTIDNDTAPIDPFFLQSGMQSRMQRLKKEHMPHPPMTIQSTSPTQTTWISRLTAPIWSVLTPGPALPPPATKADILCSSPYEPLCQLTPWEPCHMRALGPLYLSSLLYRAHIFPFNPKSPAAAYYGVTVTTSLRWSRTVTKRDCSVADAFMVLLDERGFALGEPGEQWIEEGLAIRMCVSIWMGMVMRGEIGVNAFDGETAGLRKQGDRLWTPEDINWKDNASEYFERKRRDFDGLPSWKAMGVKWPPV